MQHRNEMKEKKKNETNKRRNTIVNKQQCEMILSQTNLINVLIAPKSLFPQLAAGFLMGHVRVLLSTVYK